MITKRIVLKFPHKLLDKPIVYKLIKEYNLEFNILKAQITPNEEGLMVLELRGEPADYKKAEQYMKESGVSVQPLSKDIKRNEKRCTHCGACVTICPTGALVVDKATKKIMFISEKCIACELCVPACPPRAMIVDF